MPRFAVVRATVECASTLEATVDHQRFDELARTFASATPRRSVLRWAVGGSWRPPPGCWRAVTVGRRRSAPMPARALACGAVAVTDNPPVTPAAPASRSVKIIGSGAAPANRITGTAIAMTNAAPGSAARKQAKSSASLEPSPATGAAPRSRAPPRRDAALARGWPRPRGEPRRRRLASPSRHVAGARTAAPRERRGSRTHGKRPRALRPWPFRAP